MLQISEAELLEALRSENPWWTTGEPDPVSRDWPARAFLRAFCSLVTRPAPIRAVVLFGPRRVGKTVMLKQTIGHLIALRGVAPRDVLFVSIDRPTYTHRSLEQLLRLGFGALEGPVRRRFVIFDEIQYLPDWERHLKSLVDGYPDIQFVASGSAAAALRMQGRESGAGRFTEFLLPPLTFWEYLYFTRQLAMVNQLDLFMGRDIERLNRALLEYINYGGFPELVMRPELRALASELVASNIVDSVLLRDLPSLYGVADVQELKRLFAVLAYNSGQEIEWQALANNSGVSANTLKRHLLYLEAAFLILRLQRVDQTARRFRQQRQFKVYLTNPSLRSALFAPAAPDDPAMGHLVETAYAGQLAPVRQLAFWHYARWKTGEVDFVEVHPGTLAPSLAVEIKWSDRAFANPAAEVSGLVEFARQHRLDEVTVGTRTVSGDRHVNGVKLRFRPCAELIYDASIASLPKNA